MSRVYRWVFVWNKALDLNLARLTQKQPILWYEELNFWANLWKQSGKKDYGFLKELPAQVIQQKLKDLDKAFRDAFDKQQKHKQIPVFKCKGKSGDSIRYLPGFKIDQPNNRFKRHAEKLATLQRQLKNKLKFSRNWRKQPDEKIAHARHDYLHKISTAISENQAVIVVEDLKINNLSKSAKGKQVRQKSGLNKAILDQGWGMFVNMLDYKQNWNGGLVLKVSAHHTS